MADFFLEEEASIIVDGKLAIYSPERKMVTLYTVSAVDSVAGDDSIKGIIRLEGSWTRLNAPWRIADAFIRSGMSTTLFRP